jgi:hypothetical protein
MVSWLKSLVLKINLICLWSFLYLFLNYFFYHLTLDYSALNFIFFPQFSLFGIILISYPRLRVSRINLSWLWFFYGFFFNLFFFNFILSYLWLRLWDRENLIGKKMKKITKLFKKKIIVGQWNRKRKNSRKINRTLTYINFLYSWLKSLDQKHYTWKNHKVQSMANQISGNEIKKKNSIT